MEIISFGGYVFADHDFDTGIDYAAGRAQWSLIPQIEQRLNAKAQYTGAQVTARPIPVNIIYTGPDTYEHAFTALMGALDPLNPDPRTLVAQMNDGTEVSCEAMVLLPGAATDALDVNILLVTFLTTDPLWTETTDTTLTEPMLDASDNVRTLTNNGATAVAPTLRVHTRTISPAVALDRYRITVTNGAELPLEREVIVQGIPYSVGFDSSAALLKDGTFYPVTRHDPGAAGDRQWVAFPVTVDPGESETYDLIGQENTAGTLDQYTKFNGNYAAPDISFETWTATSGTTTTITVTGANWPVNRWAGATMRTIGGTGSGQFRAILSNTADTLTLTRAFNTAPAAGTRFTIIGSGYYNDGGIVSASTTTTLTDASQSWVPNSLVGLKVMSDDYTVTANTATQITFTPARPSALAVGSSFLIYGFNYHRYYVDQVKNSASHRGGWQINKRFTQPSKVLWGADILNAWEPFLMTENGDDYNQVRWTEILLGGSDPDYWPMLNATRRRGQDRKLQEEGQADGVAVYDPLGYQAIRFDYQFLNPNGASGATKGITKFVLSGREPGGDEFEPYVTDDTLRATLTNVAAQNVDLSAYGNPTQLYMGLAPRTGSEISRDVLESDEANVRWYQTLRLWLNVRNRLTVSVSSLDLVTPVEDEFRIGDLALQVGQRDGQRLYIKATDELYFDCANARAWIDDGAGNTTDITYAVTPWDYATNRIADRWPVLKPGANTLTITTDTWTLGGGFSLDATFAESHFG